MQRQKTQSGSVQLVIICLLIVALVSGLSYLFWQKYMQPITKKEDSSKTNENDKYLSTSNLTEIVYDDTLGTNLALKYPKTWGIDHKSNDENVGKEFYQISSPDNQISVSFIISPLVGECGYDRSNTEIIQIERDNVPKYSDLIFVSYVYEYDNNGNYDYSVGLRQKNDTTSTSKAGDLVECSLDFQSRPEIDAIPFDVKIIINKFSSGNTDYEKVTPDTFAEVTKTDNYKIAKLIVQSLYIKQ